MLAARVLLFLVLSSLASLTGCESSSTSSTAPEAYKLDEAYLEKCRTLDAIPVPMESAAQLHKLNTTFYNNLLLPSNRVDYMHTSHQQALAIGAYSADLAYIQLYKRPLQGYKHLSAVQSLAKSLDVEQAVGSALAMRDKQGGTTDSALNQLNLGFSKLCIQLQMRGQLPLSVLAVAGGWFEGMHLLFGAAATATNRDSYRSLAANQRIILDYLVSASITSDVLSDEEKHIYSLLQQAQEILAESSVVTNGTDGALTDENGLATYREVEAEDPTLSQAGFTRLAQVVAEARQRILQGSHQTQATNRAGLSWTVR